MLKEQQILHFDVNSLSAFRLCRHFARKILGLFREQKQTLNHREAIASS